MNRVLVFFMLFISSLGAFSQVNRYVVFFSDKSGDSYPYTIESPETYLTEKAISRRTKQSIAIVESDLPVHPMYVDSVRNLGVDLYFTSKWMNAALIQTEESNVESLEGLGFVDSVILVAERERLSRDKVEYEVAVAFDEPSVVSASTELQLAILQVDKMHETGNHGEGMLIAVLDNGFRGVNENAPFAHLWEDDRIVATRDFVENSGNVFRLGDHGTAVFSTIGARYKEDFYGTAYGADFILCITEEGGSEDRIEEFNWIFGAEYADSLGVDVINASLGYRLFDIDEHSYDYDDLNGETTYISRAAKMASDKGILVVVSAGNQGDNPPSKWRYVTPPADADNILTVGSINPDFTWTPFSSLGPTSDGRIKPDVSAMGLGTTIVKGSGSIGRGNGTSYSSPQMAGFAAGIWKENPDWTNLEVIAAIKKAGHQAHKPDTLIGHGVPFYTYAVAGKVLRVSDILEEKVLVYPNPFSGNKLFIKSESSIKGALLVEILDGEGKRIFKKTIKSNRQGETHELSLEGIQEGLYYLSLQYGKKKKIVKLVNF